MNDNFIKYSSPANLISLTIDKSYNITDLNIDEELNPNDDKAKFDAKDLNKIFGDLAKMSSVRFENGKPILSFSLDAISPDIMSKVNSMMDELDKNSDKDNE